MLNMIITFIYNQVKIIVLTTNFNINITYEKDKEFIKLEIMLLSITIKRII